jgi:hypothetical protein
LVVLLLDTVWFGAVGVAVAVGDLFVLEDVLFFAIIVVSDVVLDLGKKLVVKLLEGILPIALVNALVNPLVNPLVMSFFAVIKVVRILVFSDGSMFHSL